MYTHAHLLRVLHADPFPAPRSENPLLLSGSFPRQNTTETAVLVIVLTEKLPPSKTYITAFLPRPVPGDARALSLRRQVPGKPCNTEIPAYTFVLLLLLCCNAENCADALEPVKSDKAMARLALSSPVKR